MHAYRRRGRLIMFDDVDVNTQIEATVGGQRIVQTLLIRSANRKSVEQRGSRSGDWSMGTELGGRPMGEGTRGSGPW